MRTILRLLGYARPYRMHLTVTVVSMICLVATQLYAPWVVRKMIALIRVQDPDLVAKSIRYALILAGVYLLQTVFMFLRSYFAHYAAWNFVSDMRVRVYEYLQRLSLRYYHDKQTGQLMSRTSADTATFESLIAHAVPDLIVNVLMVASVTVILFSINALLASLCLVTVPFILLLAFRFARRVLPVFKEAQQHLAEFNAVLHDNLLGIKEIQVFNQQQREHTRIAGRSVRYAKTLLKFLRLSAVYHPSIQFLNNLGTVFVIGAGGYLSFTGRVPLEDIVAFVLYLHLFYHPVNTLARVNEDLQNALAGASRVFEILDAEIDVKEADDARDLGRVQGDISYRDLSFHYREGVDVLKNISLDIKAGQTVALVGPTGVGKSTMVSLLTRFYDPAAGSITFDGTDIRDVTLKSLRDNISIVLQDVFLFNGTVEENIAYGVGGASREDVIRAAQVAHAHEFIEELEDGYDSLIGERGIKLSGGQKQRLSIARAVLRNRPVLILDEATASVDVEKERLIHDAIASVIKNRTTIIIAHRLSTVKAADMIAVLDKGRITETGTHDELMRTNGLYRHLCEIQFRDSDV